MSIDTRALRELCPNCGSDNVHRFRYDHDWGYGGDYTPVNDGIPESERPDIECLHCRECHAAFDGPFYDKDGKRADYLGRAVDRLASLEAENQRLLEALEGVLGEALTYQLRESDLVVETARAAIAKAKGGAA